MVHDFPNHYLKADHGRCLGLVQPVQLLRLPPSGLLRPEGNYERDQKVRAGWGQEIGDHLSRDAPFIYVRQAADFRLMVSPMAAKSGYLAPRSTEQTKNANRHTVAQGRRPAKTLPLS